MFLANISEVPEYFYIFLGHGTQGFDEMNAHNFSLSKQLVSAGMSLALDDKKRTRYLKGDIDYLPFVRTETTTNTITSFTAKLINEYNVEHNLEIHRKFNHKKYPSRFSAIYAFGDYETCIKVSKKYGWNLSEVKKFRIKKAFLPFVKIGRFNMEIVSLLRAINVLTLSIEEQEELYKRYWNCSEDKTKYVTWNKKVIECDCIYEYLIEGILELVE